jgi:hypothetical protein
MRACASLLFLVVLFLAPSAIAAEPAACPATVNVHQQLTAPVAGWSAVNDDALHQLAGVTFYDGPPQEKASLVYDDITKAAGKQIAKWTFAPRRERATWIACSYSGTSVVLAKTLPPGIASCTVTYDARQQVAGLPVIEKIACK